MYDGVRGCAGHTGEIGVMWDKCSRMWAHLEETVFFCVSV